MVIIRVKDRVRVRYMARDRVRFRSYVCSEFHIGFG